VKRVDFAEPACNMGATAVACAWTPPRSFVAPVAILCLAESCSFMFSFALDLDVGRTENLQYAEVQYMKDGSTGTLML